MHVIYAIARLHSIFDMKTRSSMSYKCIQNLIKVKMLLNYVYWVYVIICGIPIFVGTVKPNFKRSAKLHLYEVSKQTYRKPRNFEPTDINESRILKKNISNFVNILLNLIQLFFSKVQTWYSYLSLLIGTESNK